MFNISKVFYFAYKLDLMITIRNYTKPENDKDFRSDSLLAIVTVFPLN
ncbi:MAG: hypothetical protein KGH81_02080 [Thaumarchaeota archaeon]|nr:hypothetical protein [Nitrososphaerota archaeon]MDE1878459.1 hypothetical protein [Nitrososphaerota archaeon]